MEAALALDIGTGSVRAFVIGPSGGVLSSGAVAHRSRPSPDAPAGREFDPSLLMGAVAEASRRALAGAGRARVVGVTAAGMRPACVLLDGEGEPLYIGANQDARGVAEALELLRTDRERIHRLTGQLPPILAWSARLLWFRRNRPEVLERGRLLTGLEAWVLSLFGGDPSMLDLSSASGTGLLDVERGVWLGELLERVDFGVERLPRVVLSGTEVGRARGDLARALGLEGVGLFAGGGDSQGCLAGTGCFEPGETAVAAGTTMPVMRVSSRPGPGPERLWASRHLDGGGVLEANCGPAGLAFEWIASLLGVGVEELDNLASSAPPGSLPLHAGTEPQDFSDLPLVRQGGVLWPSPPDVYGVGRDWLARGVLESAAYAVKAALGWLDEAEPGRGVLKVAGGMCRSRLWLSSLASLLGQSVEALPEHATALGVAAFALASAGVVSSPREVSRAAASRAVRVEPEAELGGALQAGFERWRELVDGLSARAVRISHLLAS